MPKRKIFHFETEPKSPEKIEESEWTAEGKPPKEYLQEKEIVEEKQEEGLFEKEPNEASPSKEPVRIPRVWDVRKMQRDPKQVGKELRGKKHIPSERRETIRRPEANP